MNDETNDTNDEAREVLLLSGGAALLVLGAGMIMTHPAIRRSVRAGLNALMPDFEQPLKQGLRGVLPDIERYLRLKGM